MFSDLGVKSFYLFIYLLIYQFAYLFLFIYFLIQNVHQNKTTLFRKRLTVFIVLKSPREAQCQKLGGLNRL